VPTVTGELVALPVIGSGCGVLSLLDPACQGVSGLGSSIAGIGADAVLGAVSGWVVAGAAWLLEQLGAVMSSSTSVDLRASWFQAHYAAMVGLAGVVVLPMVVLGVLQAIYHQSTAALVRSVLVQVPLAFLLMGVAVELVQLSLGITDELSSTVSTAHGADLRSALDGMANTLNAQGGVLDPSVPAFVTLLAGMLVATGAFVLWLELLVRAAAVYAAVLFLPLVLASTVWPASGHWCRRLADTLAALVLSKFVIVAVLSLGASQLGADTGGGLANVLEGAAMLVLAACTPFTLLRLVPMVEQGTALQLEGARRRAQATAGVVPRSAASFALRRIGAESFDPGEPGTGAAGSGAAPLGVSARAALGSSVGQGGAAGPASASGWGLGIPLSPGDPERTAAFEHALTKPGGGPGPRAPFPLSPPVWSPAPSAAAPPVDGGERGASLGASPARRGSHVIDRDRLGPVIRWVPPTDAPGERDGEGDDGG
jgi:hypothetical protein